MKFKPVTKQEVDAVLADDFGFTDAELDAICYADELLTSGYREFARVCIARDRERRAADGMLKRFIEFVKNIKENK